MTDLTGRTIVSAAQLAKAAGTTKMSIWRWRKAGIIEPAVKIGKLVGFDLEESLRRIHEHFPSKKLGPKGGMLPSDEAGPTERDESDSSDL